MVEHSQKKKILNSKEKATKPQYHQITSPIKLAPLPFAWLIMIDNPYTGNQQ